MRRTRRGTDRTTTPGRAVAPNRLEEAEALLARIRGRGLDIGADGRVALAMSIPVQRRVALIRQWRFTGSYLDAAEHAALARLGREVAAILASEARSRGIAEHAAQEAYAASAPPGLPGGWDEGPAPPPGPAPADETTAFGDDAPQMTPSATRAPAATVLPMATEDLVARYEAWLRGGAR